MLDPRVGIGITGVCSVPGDLCVYSQRVFSEISVLALGIRGTAFPGGDWGALEGGDQNGHTYAFLGFSSLGGSGVF